MSAQTRKPSAKPSRKKPDDFESVAARLECDQDLAKFDAKLRRIAKATRALANRKKGAR